MAIQIRHGEVVVRVPKLTPHFVVKRFVKKHEEWIEKKLQSHPLSPLLVRRGDQEIAEAKNLARKYILARWEYWAKKFNKNVKQFKITSAKTRWGSCTSQKNINLTYRLMFTHSKAIDYVIIHELAHLKYMNHSKHFWNHVEEMMPDYKVWHNALKKRWWEIW